ncbi:MAG TPA: hypothetical protein DIC42_05170, partial [Holosporales bacterium]|nr:hypothetical protein [Holosporales bacterium]
MDRHNDKTKEELIIELKELQQELNALKSANKKVKSNKTSLENEERYRYLFERNPQPMWVYDIESLSFLDINNAAIRHYGYSKEEFLGMTIKDIRPKEDIEALQKDIELTHQAYNLAGEWRHLKKNGEIIFVEIISHAITFNNRKARHVMANDITLQKKALEDRTEALMLYNALIDQAGDAFFVHDFDGKFIEVNQQACDTLGYSKEELLKLSVADVEIDFDLKSAKKEWVKIERGHKFTVYGNHIRKDGTAFPVEVRFGCAQWKGQKLFLALARDITERNKAEESLRQSEENLYITLNSIGDGVIATDLNGRVVNMNPVAAKLCGWSLIDAAGKPLAEVFNIVNADTRETVINPVKKVLENGEIIGLANHTVLISKNGTEYQISDSAAPIKNKEGKISGVVLVFSDVTEKYLNEQSLIENEERLNLFFKQSLTGFFFMETDHPIIWDDTIDKEKTLDEVLGQLRVTKVNQALLDQYLTTEDEFINRTLYDFFAHDLKQGRKVIKDLFDKGILHIDTSERRSDGTQIWIEGDYICLYDSKGRIKGLFGTQHDITVRKQAAKSLQESEEKFKNIFHNHSAVKIIINPENGNIVEANLAAANFYGWTIAELQQMNLSQINALPPEQLKKEMEKARALKKIQFEFKHRKADGSIIDVEVFSSKIVFDNKDFLHSIIHDITEKKKNEEQIRLFKEAFEQSPASNIITDTQGNIVYVNPKTLKVTGYELSELIGQNPKIFSAGDKTKEEYKVLWQNIASGKEWQGEFHNKKKNGELFWELASICPILNKDGEITHYLAVK